MQAPTGNAYVSYHFSGARGLGDPSLYAMGGAELDEAPFKRIRLLKTKMPS